MTVKAPVAASIGVAGVSTSTVSESAAVTGTSPSGPVTVTPVMVDSSSASSNVSRSSSTVSLQMPAGSASMRWGRALSWVTETPTVPYAPRVSVPAKNVASAACPAGNDHVSEPSPAASSVRVRPVPLAAPPASPRSARTSNDCPTARSPVQSRATAVIVTLPPVVTSAASELRATGPVGSPSSSPSHAHPSVSSAQPRASTTRACR